MRIPPVCARIVLLSCGLLPIVGCGVVWDSDGQRRAIGVGYVSWPLPDADQKTVVYGNDVVGAAVLATRNSTGLAIGFSRERTVTMDGDRFVRMNCIECDLIDAHVDGGTITQEKDKK